MKPNVNRQIFVREPKTGPNMYPTFTKHVHYIYNTCTLHLQYMYPTSTVHVHYIYLTRTRHLVYMYTTFTLHILRYSKFRD